MTPQEQLEADEREFLRRKSLFNAMLATEAWKELEKILLAQHNGQLQALLAPTVVVQQGPLGPFALDGLAQALKSEYLKGVVFGINLTLMTPRATIASANEIIANRQEKEKDNAKRSSQPIVIVNPGFGADGERLPESAIVTDLGGGE